MKVVMSLTCRHFVVLWLSFRQSLQNVIESIDVVSSKSNALDSTAATRLLNDIIVVALKALEFVRDGIARRRRELGQDGRLTVITCRPRDDRFVFVLYVFQRSSLLTVSGLSVLGLFPLKPVYDLAFCASSFNESCWCSEDYVGSVPQIEQYSSSVNEPFKIFSVYAVIQLNVIVHNSWAYSGAIMLPSLKFRILSWTVAMLSPVANR